MSLTPTSPITDVPPVGEASSPAISGLDAKPADVESTAVEIHQPPAALFKTDDPVEVVSKATEVANALAGVIREKALFSNIQGRDHVRVEGWQLLGVMLGVTAVCTHTEEVEGGYKATVEARTADGRVIGRADALCTKSENQWRSRDDYARLSMAQTRATSKALKGPLGFIVSLAGYAPTPAEEMPPGGQHQAVSDRPYGPKMDPSLKKVTAQACVKHAGNDSQKGISLWKVIARDLGGYMPQAAALALIQAADTDNLVPDVEAPEPQ